MNHEKMYQHIIDKAFGEWRERLRACVVAGGAQFEHKLLIFLIADVLSCVIFEG